MQVVYHITRDPSITPSYAMPHLMVIYRAYLDILGVNIGRVRVAVGVARNLQWDKGTHFGFKPAL